MTMEWIDANTKDAEMLKWVDLSPLDTGPAEGSTQLTRQVQRHNKALSDLVERFDKLARDREQLNRTDPWFDHDSKAVRTERRRVVAESWDVLVTLRKLLRDRQDLLVKLQAHVAGKVGDLEEQYGQAFDAAHKALTREHRDYLRAEPVRGPDWVRQQAENDATVVALRERVAPLQDVLNTLQSLYQRAGRNNALTFRQREVFEQLN